MTCTSAGLLETYVGGNVCTAVADIWYKATITAPSAVSTTVLAPLVKTTGASALAVSAAAGAVMISMC